VLTDAETDELRKAALKLTARAMDGEGVDVLYVGGPLDGIFTRIDPATKPDGTSALCMMTPMGCVCAHYWRFDGERLYFRDWFAPGLAASRARGNWGAVGLRGG